MRKLPSRGWGPWRQEFYSLHSNPSLLEADTELRFGLWHNVWFSRVSRLFFRLSPAAWRWTVNLTPFRKRTLKRLGKFFPNLR